ncbi:hypothetical protein EXU48_15650 [Occultella glacieicola]|uniref:Uncharacterized protein n=1 Tax=Occultella glacieicola TaxID=2518684 RepID=A0ABY2E302_9MICO|nr:hypothetical protein [Occultella glacieicola]TDE91579.1 hypothetical protein EXU48_15650 [Occultella glacieicola]
MMTYVAQWPVLDDDALLSALKVEALTDLVTMTAKLHLVLVGNPEWETSEVAGKTFLGVRVGVVRVSAS